MPGLAPAAGLARRGPRRHSASITTSRQPPRNGSSPGATRASCTATRGWSPPLDWADGDDADLNASERAFLDASAAQRDADERRRPRTTATQRRSNRRLRGALAGVGVLLVARPHRRPPRRPPTQPRRRPGCASADGSCRADRQAARADEAADEALIEAQRAEQQAEISATRTQEAYSARLAAQSSQLRDLHLPLAQLLAVESNRLDPSLASLGGLVDAVDGVPALRGFIGGPVKHFGFTIDPTGRIAVAHTDTPDRELSVFDLAGQTFIRSVDVDHEVNDVIFLPDGELVVCGGGWLTSLDPRTFAEVGPSMEAGYNCELALSEDGRSVAVSTRLESTNVSVLRVADSAGGPARPAGVLFAGSENAPSIPRGGAFLDGEPAITPDGHLVAMAMLYDGVQQWDSSTGQPTGPAVMQRQEVAPGVFDPNFVGPTAAAYSPDGRHLLVGDERGAVQFLAVESLQPVGRSLDLGDAQVTRIGFSPDGTRVAVGTAVGTARVFDLETRLPVTPLLTGQGGYVYGVAFSTDGDTLFASNSDGIIAAYDAEGRSTVNTVLVDGEPDSVRTVIEVATSPDGRLLATTHYDGSVEVWDLTSGRRIDPGLHVPGPISVGIAFSPDSRRVAAGDSDGAVIVWDIESWAPVGPPLTIPGGGLLVRLAYSPDGRMLAAGREVPPTIGLYDAATLTQIGDFIRPSLGEALYLSYLRGMAFDPDGTTMATVEQFDTQVELWDVATGRKVQTLEGLKALATSAAFAPSGDRIVIGETGGTVEVFDLGTGRPVSEPLGGVQRNIVDVAYSPDGQLIAATTLDSTAQLWDADSGLPIGPSLRFDDAVADRETNLAFSPDGRALATSGPLGSVTLWDLDPDSLAEHACQTAGRNLSRDEWRRYMPADTDYRKTCPQWPEAGPA